MTDPTRGQVSQGVSDAVPTEGTSQPPALEAEPGSTDVTPDDDSVAVVSVKPLLFAGDLRALSRAEAQPSAVTQPSAEAQPSAPAPLLAARDSLASAEELREPTPPAVRSSSRPLLVALPLGAVVLAGIAVTLRLEPGAQSLTTPVQPALEASPPQPRAPAAERSPTTTPSATAANEHPPGAALEQETTPAAPGMARLLFECAPVACQSIFCDAKRYEPGQIELSPGRHTCKGAARGYGTAPVTLELAAGQTRAHRFDMVPRR